MNARNVGTRLRYSPDGSQSHLDAYENFAYFITFRELKPPFFHANVTPTSTMLKRVSNLV